MNYKTRTATEWATIVGIEIIDPDGWRGNGDQVTLETPIHIFDFMARIQESTINMEPKKVTQLIYKTPKWNNTFGFRKDGKTPIKLNDPVDLGDKVNTTFGYTVTIDSYKFPDKSSSPGIVSTSSGDYFVTVIGAEWVNRPDRC